MHKGFGFACLGQAALALFNLIMLHNKKKFFYYFILNNLKGTTSASVTVTILKKFTDA